MFQWLGDRLLSHRPRAAACCSFCGVSYRTGGPLIEGPKDIFICPACVDTAAKSDIQPSISQSAATAGNNPYAPSSLKPCSFCEQEPEIGIALTSPDHDHTICTKCVTLSREILTEHHQQHGEMPDASVED